VIVYNISDRVPSKEGPRAVPIGGVLLRPGKSTNVAVDQLAKKMLALHGSCLWFGELPPQLRSKPRVRAATEPMSVEEIEAYLTNRSVGELLDLAAKLTPPLLFRGQPAQVIAQRLTGVLTKGERIPDPEAFFWLRRWVRSGDTYSERS
jgi:hypothetical protein